MTKMVKALKLSNELEKKALADEDIEIEECPKEGYHKAENDSNNEGHQSRDQVHEPATEIPENIKFLRETIQHCRHFISMIGRPHWQLLSMEIVGESMLQVQMQENELLPLVHLVWQPLKLLFSSNNLFVVEKAFHVLRIMAQCAKNFIRRRTLDDIFPDLVTYIKKLQIMVNARGLQQTMAARQSRRLLREMTKGLWDFMSLLDLSESEVDPIIEHMLQFVKFANENRSLIFRGQGDQKNDDKMVSEFEAYFTPVRQMDSDILWLKTLNIEHAT